MPMIWFFLPYDKSIEFPEHIDQYLPWHQAHFEKLNRVAGPYAWVLQTYLQFKARGKAAQLTRELPDEGIVIAHRDHLEDNIEVTSKRYLVCALADRLHPHPYANHHILCNPYQRLRFSRPSHYIPHWAQPGLIPRAENRGERFENARFFGNVANLDTALSSSDITDGLHTLGLRLEVPAGELWHDFSNCDVVIGIRSFGTGNPWLNRPPTKLYNAWLGGVPAILGYEVAFRHAGDPGRNYLEASTPDNLFQALERLSDDRDFRLALVDAGTASFTEFDDDHVFARWMTVIDDIVVPGFDDWRRGSLRTAITRLGGNLLERIEWRYSTIYAAADTPLEV